MRKVIVSNMVTVDGFFAGPNDEIDWHVVDDEFNQYADELLHAVDTLLFGRVTYDLMASYWPTEAALGDDPIIAAQMNAHNKVVFSRTLQRADWEHTTVAHTVAADEIAGWKQQPGKDLVIFGSGEIVRAFTQLGLIDEYRLFVNPVILGSGKPLFAGLAERQGLRLLETRPFRSGNVLLRYQPEPARA